MEPERSGCATLMMEELESPLIKANRLILRLQAACIAADNLLTEAMRNDAEHLEEVVLVRAAILESEKYISSFRRNGKGRGK